MKHGINYKYARMLSGDQKRKLETLEAKHLKAVKKEWDAIKELAGDLAEAAADQIPAGVDPETVKAIAESTGRSVEETQKELDALAAASQNKEYRKKARKLARLEEKHPADVAALYDEFMRDYFKALTDPAEILADFSARVNDFIEYADAWPDCPRTPSGAIETEFIIKEINADLLPYYVEALANTGAENAGRSLRECVYTQLHNNTLTQYTGTDPDALADPSGEAAAEIMQPKPSLYSLAIMQDKLSRSLSKPGRPLEFAGFTEEKNGQLKMVWDVEHEAAKGAEPIYTIAMLHTENPLTVTAGNVGISFLERKIIEIIGNEYHNHKNTPAGRIGSPLYITPARLWLTLTGKANDYQQGGVYESQQEAMKRIMDKLRFLRVSLEVTDELNARKLAGSDERFRNGKIDTYAINADFVSVTTSRNQHVEAYRINGTVPINYAYAAAKKQLSFIRYELVDVSEAFKSEMRAGRVASDPETIAIKFYLLESIYAMYSGFRDNTAMLYETIYKETGTAPRDQIRPENYTTPEAYGAAVRRQEKRLRDRIAAMLDYWTQKGFIKGFIVGKTTDGRKLAGVSVVLYPKNPYPVEKKK